MITLVNLGLVLFKSQRERRGRNGGRGKAGEKERAITHPLTHSKMLTTLSTGSGQLWQPGTQSGSLHRKKRLSYLSCYLLLPRVCICRKPESEVGAKTPARALQYRELTSNRAAPNPSQG